MLVLPGGLSSTSGWVAHVCGCRSCDRCRRRVRRCCRRRCWGVRAALQAWWPTPIRLRSRRWSGATSLALLLPQGPGSPSPSGSEFWSSLAGVPSSRSLQLWLLLPLSSLSSASGPRGPGSPSLSGRRSRRRTRRRGRSHCRCPPRLRPLRRPRRRSRCRGCKSGRRDGGDGWKCWWQKQ